MQYFYAKKRVWALKIGVFYKKILCSYCIIVNNVI